MIGKIINCTGSPAIVLRNETYGKAHLQWPGAPTVSVSAQRPLYGLSGYIEIVESDFPVNTEGKFELLFRMQLLPVQ